MNMVKTAYDSVATEYADKFFHELAAKPLDRKVLDMFSERVAQSVCVKSAAVLEKCDDAVATIDLNR